MTKGARTKIVLSIRKLARRPETLAEIEQVRNHCVCVCVCVCVCGCVWVCGVCGWMCGRQGEGERGWALCVCGYCLREGLFRVVGGVFRGLFRKQLFVAALCVRGCCGGVSLSGCH